MVEITLKVVGDVTTASGTNVSLSYYRVLNKHNIKCI
jgi:hypothetical protein